jgi:transcriptional regulator with XRE-family HTH domain
VKRAVRDDDLSSGAPEGLCGPGRDRLAQHLMDRAPPSAVHTLAGVAQAAFHFSCAMEKEHFGNFLRRARESRDIPLSAVALKTKVSRSTLEQLESGEIDGLPAGVYVRGFIRSFARAVGSDETQPLLLYERALEARSEAEKTRSATPVPDPPELLPGVTEDESVAPRGRLGLAVFVIILLLIATITLSLLLRRPPPSGEGLSLAPATPSITPPAAARALVTS